MKHGNSPLKENWICFFINPFPNKPLLLRVCSISLWKTLGKGEIVQNEQFLLFPQCFLPHFGELSTIIIKFEIVIYKVSQFESV